MDDNTLQAEIRSCLADLRKGKGDPLAALEAIADELSQRHARPEEIRIRQLETIASSVAGILARRDGQSARRIDVARGLLEAVTAGRVVDAPILREEIYAAAAPVWDAIDRVCGPGVDWEWVSNRTLSFLATHGLADTFVQHLARIEEYERAEEDGTLCVSCQLRPAREGCEDCDECHERAVRQAVEQGDGSDESRAKIAELLAESERRARD